MFIWEAIDGKRNIRDITAMMAEEFDVGPDEAEKDILEFLEQVMSFLHFSGTVTVDLVIAGRRIRLQSDYGISLRPDERFAVFTTAVGGGPELTIEVKSGRAVIPAGAAKVFNAPLLEDAPAGPQQSGVRFWEVAADEKATYVRVTLKEPARFPLLIIPRGKMSWQFFADEAGSEINPLPYPVDGLILYFLTSMKGDIMIHGSGVISDGKGWIFTGKSGSGKTTMAKIFDSNGDRVVHDDRLILVKEGARWRGCTALPFTEMMNQEVLRLIHCG